MNWQSKERVKPSPSSVGKVLRRKRGTTLKARVQQLRSFHGGGGEEGQTLAIAAGTQAQGGGVHSRTFATAEAPKMDPRGTMVLRLLVCVTVVLVSDAVSQKSEAYFNRTAFLPCQFVNSQNKSLAELVLFWQDQETLVLYELYLGKEKLDNVNAKYLGRTSFDPKSWTLQLHNVRIQDKGSYQCYIQHKGPTGLILLHKMRSELSVLANFSEPEIVPVSNISRNSGINLTCLSRQGYPKPKKMYFALKSQNSTTHYSGNMQISEDNATKLYSVSVHLSVPFPSGAGNVTIFCVLELEPKKTQLLSLPFFADPKDPIPVKKDQRFWIAVVFLIVIAVVAVIAIHKRRKKQQPDVSHKGETAKVEREESEQMEESPGCATLLKENKHTCT